MKGSCVYWKVSTNRLCFCSTLHHKPSGCVQVEFHCTAVACQPYVAEFVRSSKQKESLFFWKLLYCNDYHDGWMFILQWWNIWKYQLWLLYRHGDSLIVQNVHMCQDWRWALTFSIHVCWSGGRLNIKMSSFQYRDPHVKDKTVSRPSYL